MVLKKPYAFLIKHFRMLHLILFACLGYVLFNLNIIRNFFSGLYASSTLYYENATSYADNWLYYVPLFIIALSAIIFLLLRKKNKPYGLYLIILIYGVVLLFGYMYITFALEQVSKTSQTMDTIGLYRDIVILVMAPSVVLSVYCFIRGIGFDVKKFNFSRDIKELEIVDQDSAEYEVMIGQDTYIYKRTIRRIIRELKYYILENKIPIVVVFGGAIIVTGFFGFRYYSKNFKKVETTYAEQIGGVFYQVNDAYVTKFDFRGKEVLPDKKYVIVNLLVKNNNAKETSLNLQAIQLGVGNGLYYNPVTTKNTQFIDLGVPYAAGEEIPGGKTIDGLTLAFELPAEVTIREVNNFSLRIRSNIAQSSDDIFGVYKYFNVAAKSIDTDKYEEAVCLNQQFSFDDGLVNHNQATFVINNVEKKDTIVYSYVMCSSGKNGGCRVMSNKVTVHDAIDKTNKSLLGLDYSMDASKDSYFMRNIKSNGEFFEKFVYTKSKKTRTTDYVKVKAEEYDKMYLEIDALSDDEMIYFGFRNHTYVVYLDPSVEVCKSVKNT